MTDIWNAIAVERNRAADEFEHLTDAQLGAQSPCEAWNVQQLCAHMILPFEYSTLKTVFGILANGGSLDRFAKKATLKIAEQNSHAEVIAKLRANADSRWTPPGPFGAEVPLGEIVVHAQDVRKALDMPTTTPGDTIDLLLAKTKDAKVNAEYARRIGDYVAS